MPLGIVLIIFGVLVALFFYVPLGVLIGIAGAVVIANTLRSGGGS